MRLYCSWVTPNGGDGIGKRELVGATGVEPVTSTV